MHSIVCTAFAFYTNCSKQCLIINFCALLCAIADGKIRTTSLAEIGFNNKSEQCNAEKKTQILQKILQINGFVFRNNKICRRAAQMTARLNTIYIRQLSTIET